MCEPRVCWHAETESQFLTKRKIQYPFRWFRQINWSKFCFVFNHTQASTSSTSCIHKSSTCKSLSPSSEQKSHSAVLSISKMQLLQSLICPIPALPYCSSGPVLVRWRESSSAFSASSYGRWCSGRWPFRMLKRQDPIADCSLVGPAYSVLNR